MNNENILDKVILVGMNEANISTDKKPIIGTDALATCVGVLLYNEKLRKAIVAHSSTDVELILCQLVDIIEKENFASSDIQYKIIPGYYYNHYDVELKLSNFFKSSKIFIPMKEAKIKSSDIGINKDLECKYFAFDTRTGNFVTKNISFSKLHDHINKKHIEL